MSKINLGILIYFISFLFNIRAQDYISESSKQKKYFGNGCIIFKNPTISYNNNSTIYKGAFTLNINADFQMQGIWIIGKNGDSFYDMRPSQNYSFKGGIDTLQIITSYYEIQKPYQHTIFCKEIILNENIVVNIKMTEANKKVYFQPLRIDSMSMIINQIDFLFNNKRTEVSLAFLHAPLETNNFTLYYNQFFTNEINCEWFVKGKQKLNNGDLYLLNGELSQLNNDTIYHNNPKNLVCSNFNYNLPDSIVVKNIHIGVLGFHHFYMDDPKYTLPIKLNIYQDTSASCDLLSSKFKHMLDLTGDGNYILASTEMCLNNDKVIGYLNREQYENPFYISDLKDSYFGYTPVYWYGKFINNSSKIGIRGQWGINNTHQLFLSQTNDVLKLYPNSIKISSDNKILYDKEILSKTFPDLISAGYEPDSLQYSVLPDKYTVEIINAKSEVAHKSALTKAIAKFDLRKEDKNPPNMNLFQILTDKRINNILTPSTANIIRFNVDDDFVLRKVNLFYSVNDDTNLTELPLTYINSLYQAEVPQLTNGYYSLTINAEDTSGNALTVQMNPAFLFDQSTSVNSAENETLFGYRLYQNYPNPFNPVTKIKYIIPVLTSFLSPGERMSEGQVRVMLKVYDILGNEVSTLVNEEQSAGEYEVEFSAEGGGSKLASGVYFYILKVGNHRLSKKMCLIK